VTSVSKNCRAVCYNLYYQYPTFYEQAIFGHVRRFSEDSLTHTALILAVNAPWCRPSPQ